MVPLFDVNTHPTLSGESSFAYLRQQLDDSGFIGGCAVSLPGSDRVDDRVFYEASLAHRFHPVAAWQDVAAQEIEGRLHALSGIGYTAIKIHPRRSGLSVRDRRFGDVLRSAASAGIAVFHCTYQFGGGSTHAPDPLPALMDAVESAPGLRMVLLHGGTVEALRYAECIRSNHNLLLDLSFTLNRYCGSSLDLDLSFLFRTFDRRICLGSDFPDYRPADVRARFEQLSAGLSDIKRENIAWRNISAFLGMELAK